MHFTTLLTSTIALLSATATAATINRARSPQTSSPSVPSYTVTFTSQLEGSQTLYSAADGTVSDTLAPGDVLYSIAVNNPADNANCVVRDVWGNQIRAFGGPGQDVDSVTFVEADGKQVRYIACVPA
jgi:hypothetical protein